MDQILLVNEIFRSLQGEGYLTGVPTSFLRLQGCNLACKYCDTLYASRGLDQGTRMSMKDVIDQIRILPTRLGNWICITGGEPLLQEQALNTLINHLYELGIKTSIETNGSFPVPQWYSKVDSWIPDIKCPSSGEAGQSFDSWLSLRPVDQGKFVVGTREDLLFVDRVLRHLGDAVTSTILVSPSITLKKDGTLTKESREWLPVVADFCRETNLRFSLQIHKFIWGQKRGV